MLLLFKENGLNCVLLCVFLLFIIYQLKQLRTCICHAPYNLTVIWLLKRVNSKLSLLNFVFSPCKCRKIDKFLPLTPFLVQIRALPLICLHLAYLCKVIIRVPCRWRGRPHCCHLVPCHQQILRLIICTD
jgi:hypothetical protein